MSLDRRRELVRIARKYDALIVADDVYDFVHWEMETDSSADVSPTDDTASSTDSQSSPSTPSFTPPSSSTSSLGTFPPTTFKSIIPRLVDVDRTLDGGPIDQFGSCVSNGSFSKLVGPGCRVGWAEGSPAFASGLSQAYDSIRNSDFRDMN
jgi:DNA-binding transcriptional MocR family regulator